MILLIIITFVILLFLIVFKFTSNPYKEFTVPATYKLKRTKDYTTKTMFVVGCNHHDTPDMNFDIDSYISRENNSHDKFAVGVYTLSGRLIGYLEAGDTDEKKVLDNEVRVYGICSSRVQSAGFETKVVFKTSVKITD